MFGLPRSFSEALGNAQFNLANPGQFARRLLSSSVGVLAVSAVLTSVTLAVAEGLSCSSAGECFDSENGLLPQVQKTVEGLKGTMLAQGLQCYLQVFGKVAGAPKFGSDAFKAHPKYTFFAQCWQDAAEQTAKEAGVPTCITGDCSFVPQ